MLFVDSYRGKMSTTEFDKNPAETCRVIPYRYIFALFTVDEKHMT
jgi:hypothetical protein